MNNIYEIIEVFANKFSERIDSLFPRKSDITAINEKLDSVEEGAQVNKIEVIELNGKTASISGKTINLEVLVAADLANYYTSDEVDQKISAIPKFAISVVNELPTSEIETATVYLVPSGSENLNLYTEYIYVDGKWEKLGEQKIDLSDMSGATASEAGKAGLVPAPPKGAQNSFLRGDGTWVEMEEVTDADIDAIIAGTFN